MRDFQYSTSHPAHPMGEAYNQYSVSNINVERLVSRSIQKITTKVRAGREL